MAQTDWVNILNMDGDRGKLKASIIVDRLVARDIAFQFGKVDGCYRVSVQKDDAEVAAMVAVAKFSQ